MKIIRLFSLFPLLFGTFLSGMQPARPAYHHPQAENRRNQLKEQFDQLKKAVFEKASPATIQEMIDAIGSTLTEAKAIHEKEELWTQIISPQKASLIGNAESAARVVDLQVQQLVRRNKPVPAELQEQHANARTNIHLIKDFLYPLEKEMIHSIKLSRQRVN